MDTNHIMKVLSDQMGEEQLFKDVSMKEHSSFKAGGHAALMVIPNNIAQLRYTMNIVSENKVPYYILGNGTNVLVKDGGYNGVIVKIGSAMGGIKVIDDKIEVEAGALLKDVAETALTNQLSGFEFASGIPGSIGGAAFMNAGAYGGDMSSVVEKVHVLTGDGENTFYLSKEEMEYGYRSSRLMGEDSIILSVLIKLNFACIEEITSKMSDFNRRRREKQPLDLPSGGSFFKRPLGNYAGTLIEKSGLKGTKVGGAKVSELHAGFIVNTGGATAKDIVELMKIVQNKVYELYQIRLEPEIRIIGEEEE